MSSSMQRRRPTTPFLALTLLGVVACGDDPVGPEVIEEVDFASSLEIDLAQMTRTADGLYYQDVLEGVGDPVQDGAEISVSYTGWRADGTQFDSGSFSFVLGEAGFIAGWNIGIRGMKLEGIRKVVIPPELGYGTNPQAHPLGGAVLVFQIELTAVN